MTPDTLTDQQIIERLATEVMGWRPYELLDLEGWECAARPDENCGSVIILRKNWNPLISWDDWRQVEEKLMEDAVLVRNFLSFIPGEADYWLEACKQWMKADLRTRCLAALSAITPHQ